MRAIRTLSLIIAVTATITAFAEEELPVKPDSSSFTKLRMDYAKRKDYSPFWQASPAREEFFSAYREKEYQKAFDLSLEWLKSCPVDIEGHIVCAAAASKLGDLKGYIHHMNFAYGLLQSITDSGDGKTPATAYKVISVAEEYAMLREFGAQPTKQALLKNQCDVLTCTFPNNETVEVHFDVSIPLSVKLE